MLRAALAAVLIAGPASAATVRITDLWDGPLSTILSAERGGPYATGWSSCPSGANGSDHFGRGAGTYEDCGMGRIKVRVAAGATTAAIALMDVGDTNGFARFSAKVSGSGARAVWSRAGDNAGLIYALFDLEEGDRRSLLFRTYLLPGLPDHRQDGYAVANRVAPVPLPGAAGLLGLGIVALAWLRRRRSAA